MKTIFFTLILYFFTLTIVNAQQWRPLGKGLSRQVNAIALYRGELYANGKHDKPGTPIVKGLVKWNGTK